MSLNLWIESEFAMHSMVNGGIRAMVAIVLTFYIMVAMFAKVSVIAG